MPYLACCESFCVSASVEGVSIGFGGVELSVDTGVSVCLECFVTSDSELSNKSE